MKNKHTKETIVALILVLLLFVLWNPANILMTDMLHMMLAGLLLVVFGIFSSLILREQAIDEREEIHRSLAGRTAFLVGSTILIIGIFVQVLRDEVDMWLVFALVAMIISKIGVRWYSEKNR